MRKQLTSSLVMIVLLALAVHPCCAKEVTITPVENPEALSIDLGYPTRQACQVANFWATPAWAIGGFIAPPEQYKLAFDPNDACLPVCPLGWKLTSVHILLQTSAACDLVMSVDLEDASYPDLPDCPWPGVVDCVSPNYTVNIPSAGLWDINMPIDCDCAFYDYIYLLGVTLLDVSCVDGFVPDLVTDNNPVTCCSYNNFGQGWSDLVVSYSFPGNLMIWGDAECCDVPVGDENSSWGSVKGLYR